MIDRDETSRERQRNAETEHVDAVLALVEDIQRRGRIDLESALGRINRTNLQVVPGARYAGITVLDDSGAVTTLGATDDPARRVDDVQRETQEGPCLSAAWSQHTIHIDDLTVEHRWPRFREAALSRTPVRSMLSYKLFDDRHRIAALNFHAESPGVFDEESVELGLLAAAHTTMAWNIVNREEQFKSALASRDVIGQAKGIIMERFDLDAVSAFELLKRLSQERNVRLVDIAERVARRES